MCRHTIFALLFLFSYRCFGADSVFVEGAFSGTWQFTINGSQTASATITPLAEATGAAQINTFGDPNFNANNCPSANERREYYQFTYGTSNAVACTNGQALIIRTRNTADSSTATIRVTQAHAGPPATFSGSGTSSNGGTLSLSAVHLSGGAVPLARVVPDSVTLLTVTPAAGTTLNLNANLNFEVTATVRMTAHRSGNVRAVFYDGLQPLRTSTSTPISDTAGAVQVNFTLSSVIIPASSQLSLRVEILPVSTNTVSASGEARYSVYQPAPLTVAPNPLRFTALAGTTPQTEILALQTPFIQAPAYTAAIVNGSTWLTLGAASGFITPLTSLPVTANPTGLDPGYYFDTIRVTTSSGSVTVPVTFQVTAPEPSLTPATSGLRFDSRQGQGTSLAQTLRLYHSGASGTSTAWSARVTTGFNVIEVSPASGTASPGNPSTLTVSLTSTATVNAGTRYALIEITAPQSAPQYITVVSDVQTLPSPVIPLPSPAALTFIANQGAPAPAPQQLRINVSAQDGRPFSVNATVQNGPPGWLSATSNGFASTSAPGSVNVTVNQQSMTPGAYTGVVTINIGTMVRVARVTFIVRPPGTIGDAISRTREAIGCTPTRVVIAETKLANDFILPAAWPAALSAQMFDDCGDRITNGTLIATFNNGDAPLRFLRDAATGDFSATWVPQGALLSTTRITLRGSSGVLTPATVEISGTINPNPKQPPVLVSSGILNNLNPILGAPLAPGTVVQIYGDNFFNGDGFESAAAPPLEPRFKDAQILVGGSVAPLYYISRTQAAAQLPTDLVPGRSYPVLMEVNGAYSAPQTIETIAAFPGTVSSGASLVAQHAADYSLVTAQSPAKPGESLIIYLVGMGTTTPPVATGDPAPVSPLAEVAARPTVTIDGQTAQIQFAGLTPGFAGLYQINLVVPANARSGSLDVVITQGNVKANATKLAVGN
jgi:uncharacterized protein (TIGR03437 family)